MAAIQSPPTCEHTLVTVGPFQAEFCHDLRRLEWADTGLEPEVIFARLFGSADLVATLPELSGRTVLVYRPSPRAQGWMRSLPRSMWIEALDGMWMSHDGARLLLRPDNPLVAENLTRRRR